MCTTIRETMFRETIDRYYETQLKAGSNGMHETNNYHHSPYYM